MEAGKLGKQLKNLKQMNSKKGMTLVEIVASLAILSLVMILLISVYGASINLIRSSGTQKNSNKNAASGIENAIGGFDPDAGISIVNRQSGVFTVRFSGATIDSPGNYVAGSDASGGSKLHYFNPN